MCLAHDLDIRSASIYSSADHLKPRCPTSHTVPTSMVTPFCRGAWVQEWGSQASIQEMYELPYSNPFALVSLWTFITNISSTRVSISIWRCLGGFDLGSFTLRYKCKFSRSRIGVSKNYQENWNLVMHWLIVYRPPLSCWLRSYARE